MDRKAGRKLKKVKHYYKAIDDFAPFATAESWDNVGLLVGGMEEKVTGVLLALDVTSRVIEESEEKKASLIITHHPVIFSPIKKLDSSSLVYQLAKKNISVISAHTNLDMAKGGVNDRLAELLKLENIQPFSTTEEKPYYKIIVFVPPSHHESVYTAMAQAGAGVLGNYTKCSFHHTGIGRFVPQGAGRPTIGKHGQLAQIEEVRLEMLVKSEFLKEVTQAMLNAHPYEEPAYDIFVNQGAYETVSLGRFGALPTSLSPQELAVQLKSILQSPTVKYQDYGKEIQKVAVCGGSGGDLLPEVLALGVDAFITGEVRHDQLLTAQESGLCLFEVGHFASENSVLEPLYQLLTTVVGKENISISTACTDGVKAV